MTRILDYVFFFFSRVAISRAEFHDFLSISPSWNQKLSAAHNKTICDSYDISDPKLIKKVNCFINWSEDRIEVNYEHNIQHQLKFTAKKVLYDVTDRFTFKPVRRILEVNSADETRESSCVKTKLCCSTFATLLSIFSPHKKVINIEFEYLCDFKTYTTTFVCNVPDIEQK